jgi:hypothetical protein
VERTMSLFLICLLHPRQYLERMTEIGQLVERFGWSGHFTYGIIINKVGHYVEFAWGATKASLDAARAELATHGILPTECEVYPGVDYPAVLRRRRDDGYFDDMTVPA